MPDMWMDVDTALAEVPVNILPLTDDTDFKSREESVAYNAAGMELIWHFTATAGATTATVVTPTTGGAYDWAHQDGGMYTIEIPASGGASINNDTEGFGWFTGVATGVLPWRGPVIGFRAAAINNALIDGATVDVNVTAMADDVITAAKFDESTAFPLKSADTGATAVARTGEDSDTLEVLSDEIAAVATTIGTAGAGLTAITGAKLHADYDAAKTAASQTSVNDLPTNAELATALASADDAVLAELANATYGLSALETLVDGLESTIGVAGAGLTALGDTRIANLDAAITTRSTYAGADTAGTTTLLARLSALWAAQLDAAVSTRLAAADYTAPDNTGIADIPTNAEFTNALAALNDFDPSTDKVDLVDAPNATALVAMAVALLDTLLSEGDADALNARTVRSALRAIRNKSGTVGGTLTVCKEDDSATAWTAAVTEDASAEPITEIDPA